MATRCSQIPAAAQTSSALPRIAALCQSPSCNRSTDRPANCAGSTCTGAQTKAEQTFASRNRFRRIPAIPAISGTVERSTGTKRQSATLMVP